MPMARASLSSVTRPSFHSCHYMHTPFIASVTQFLSNPFFTSPFQWQDQSSHNWTHFQLC